jgi:hypothetical protein
MSVIAKGISKLFKPKRRRGPKAKAKAEEQVKVLKQERKSKPVQKPPNREGQASTSKSKNPDAVFESGDNKITAGRSSSSSIIDNVTPSQKKIAKEIVALEKKVREGTATSAEKTELKRLDKINRDDTSRAAKSGAFTRGTSARKKRLEAALQRKTGGKVVNKRSGGSMKKGLDKASKSLKNRESKVKRSTLKELGDKYMDPLGLRNLKKLEKMIDERNMTPKPKKKRKPFDPYETMEAKAGGKVLYKKHGGKVIKETTSGDDLISSCYD